MKDIKAVVLAIHIVTLSTGGCGCAEDRIEGNPDGSVDPATESTWDAGDEDEGWPLPGCGNGIVDPGEECDDGPGVEMDGCVDCEIVATIVNPPEFEENGLPEISIAGEHRLAIIWARSPDPFALEGTMGYGRIMERPREWAGPAFRVSTMEDCPEPGCHLMEFIGGRGLAYSPLHGLLVAWHVDRSSPDLDINEVRARWFDPITGSAGAEMTLLERNWLDSVAFSGLDHIVVTTSQDGNAYVSMFDVLGSPVRATFTANEMPESSLQETAVASSPMGNIVVVWTSLLDGVLGKGVTGHLLDWAGSSISGEFPVSEETSHNRTRPAVSISVEGPFVVVWESTDEDGYGRGVFAKVFNGEGSPVTGELQVNQTTWEDQEDADVAVLEDDTFVVVWQSDIADSSPMVMCRKFSLDGTPVTDEFPVGAHARGEQSEPAVAALLTSSVDAGEFAVVWSEVDDSSGRKDILVQHFYGPGEVLEVFP